MARQLITGANSLDERIFHADGKGLRGVHLLSPNGVRDYALSVCVYDEFGKRKGLTTLSLKHKDFNAQWDKAVGMIAEYYRVHEGSARYKEMQAAKAVFMANYGIKLKPVTIQQAEFTTHD